VERRAVAHDVAEVRVAVHGLPRQPERRDAAPDLHRDLPQEVGVPGAERALARQALDDGVGLVEHGERRQPLAGEGGERLVAEPQRVAGAPGVERRARPLRMLPERQHQAVAVVGAGRELPAGGDDRRAHLRQKARDGHLAGQPRVAVAHGRGGRGDPGDDGRRAEVDEQVAAVGEHDRGPGPQPGGLGHRDGGGHRPPAEHRGRQAHHAPP
jgi:hypothetical protein